MPNRPALAFLLLLLTPAALVMTGCTQRSTPGLTPTAPPPASVAATPEPTHSTTPSTTPTATPKPVNPRELVHTSIPPAPDRDLYRLASQLWAKPGAPEIPRVVNPAPPDYAPGRKDTFWLIDLASLRMYQESFELRLVTPRAYWYVAEGHIVDQQELERAAASFEAEVYPRVTEAFGTEWSPGVDNDTRISIINARLRGAGGYVIGGDEYAQSVYPYSNQREMVYINTAAFPVGSPSYLATVAHELQHLVHWNSDPSEDTWITEGLADLASTLSGGRRISFDLGTPQVSLVNWPQDGAGLGAHYAAAALFTHYLWEHYTRNDSDLLQLVRQPENGVAGVEAYLRAQGYSKGFREVFQDWVVANFLDEAQGVYGYRTQKVEPRGLESLSGYSQFSGQVPQYAARYLEIPGVSDSLNLRVQGVPETPLIPVDAGDAGCWWSNSGDTISSTLTHALDLTSLTEATLTYQVWHQVEKDWDYGYLEASTDGGQTWTVLETPRTTRSNPVGNSYGPGYTGNSQGWLDERVSLSAFAGRRILIRFHYVTDDGVNNAGLCFRQISAPEAGLTPASQGWQAEGFLLTGNRVAQEYLVQVVETGAPNRVTQMVLDPSNRGELVVQPPPAPGRLVVVVAALAPKTRQPAPYTLTVEPAG